MSYREIRQARQAQQIRASQRAYRERVIRSYARKIADEIISAARNSGRDPIAWVTGNAYMPPMRSFTLAELVWQDTAHDDCGESFAWLCELTESHLSDADVALECPEYDNALYAVDLARFAYADREGLAMAEGEYLQDDWQPITAD